METASMIFTSKILYENNLTGRTCSAKRREELGRILGVGYANGKQLVKRLNGYSIPKDQFLNALKELD
jgi:ribonuclease M5